MDDIEVRRDGIGMKGVRDVEIPAIVTGGVHRVYRKDRIDNDRSAF
jgi:hypothetical protein